MKKLKDNFMTYLSYYSDSCPKMLKTKAINTVQIYFNDGHLFAFNYHGATAPSGQGLIIIVDS